MDAFERDLRFLVAKLVDGMDEGAAKKLDVLRDKLVDLHDENVVKINHSVMELVCAKHLILKGYDVDVEHPIDKKVICDLYGVKGYGTLIVEVETGFVPPEHALDPLTYCKARITSKIARYSNYADKFGLGIPPHYWVQILPALSKPPKYRREEELREIKYLCDLYYKNPPVSLEEIMNARLHAIYIINVDGGAVDELSPDMYLEATSLWSNWSNPGIRRTSIAR